MTRETIAKVIAPYTHAATPPELVRLPGRAYAAAFFDPGRALPDAPPVCTLLDVPLIASVTRRGEWACFTLTDAFYTACVRHVRQTLPAPADDQGSLALNHMLAAGRRGGEGCPAVPEVQRALWLLLGGEESRAIRKAGEEAFLSMTLHLPPRDRQALLNECGDMADACARILGNLVKESTTCN